MCGVRLCEMKAMSDAIATVEHVRIRLLLSHIRKQKRKTVLLATRDSAVGLTVLLPSFRPSVIYTYFCCRLLSQDKKKRDDD
jgi:hypothetical protein